jgi:4-hydroxy-tetrahydrodipicolinate synthase
MHDFTGLLRRQAWSDMHNRMKEALVLLGRLPRAVVRPPLVKLDDAEINRLRLALAADGVMRLVIEGFFDHSRQAVE